MKKVLYVPLVLSVIFVFICFGIFTIQASDLGAKFSSQLHSMSKPFEETPRTFDAVIYLPKSHNDRGGVILGNYGGGKDCISFELYSNGVPRLYYTDSSGSIYNYLFDKVDVRTDKKPVRLTLVQDSNSKTISCYLDGVRKQTLNAIDLPDNFIINRAQNVGGDSRSGNSQYFKGILYSLNIYSVALTEEQISQNKGVGLMAGYDFSSQNNNKDLSDNGYNLSGDIEITDFDNVSTPNETDVKGGLSFSATEQYITSNVGFSDVPQTFSTWIYLPKSQNDRGGVIIGNYESSGIPCFSIEIHSSGAPRFYYIDSNKRIIDAIYSNCDIRKGDWVNLVFTVSDKITCYLNGEYVGQSFIGSFDLSAIEKTVALGGDMRSGNAQYFKGKIREVTLFNEVLSSSDIKTLYSNGYSSFSDKIIANYDLSDAERNKDIEDISGNDNKIHSKIQFFNNKEPINDFSYSFAFVGDTQIVTEFYPDKLSKIYDWIIQNKENKKIEYVFGLGDITNADTDKEWGIALKQISKLNSVIPYSLVRGNHDTTSMFDKYFNINVYKDQFEGFYENSINNSWRTFKAGKVNYLFITLDYGPDDNVLKWASDIIEAHPNHQVIITTHAYLFRDGTTLDDKDVWPPSLTGGTNDGDDIWDKLVSKHENIVLVVSGHDPCDKIVATQVKGEKGNTVTQVLIDPQGVDSSVGATGMVALFHFSEDGSEVQIEYYSTVLEQYFLMENQFSITLPVSHIVSEDIDEDFSKESDEVSADISNITDDDSNSSFWIYLIIALVILGIFIGVIALFIKKR